MRWAAPAIRAGGQADATETGDSGEKKRGWRVPGPVSQGLIAFVIYLVVMVLGFAQPLLPHLNVPHVEQVQVDANFYIWAISWWPYALTHGLNPLFSSQIMAPAGISLAWATTTPSVALLMWPVTAAIGPIAAFNLTLILAPPASAWAAFVAIRRLTGKFWPSLLAGTVFGFCDYEMSHEASGQPNLTVTLLIPLIAYLVLRWWDGSLSRRRFLIWMTLALAAEFYTFVEAFVDVTMVAVVALVIGYLVAGRELRAKVSRLALHGAIAYAGAIVLAAPYLYFALKNYSTSSFTHTEGTDQYAVDVAGLVLPRAAPDRLLGMTWWRAAAGHDLTTTIYVGIPLLLLFALAAVFLWSNRLIRLLAPLYVIIFLLALGPDLTNEGKEVVSLPWGFIWRLPFLKSAEPQRLMDIGQLVLAIILALWLAQVTESALVRAGRWALAVVSVAAIFANLPTFASVVVPPAPRPGQWVRAVPSLPMTDQIPPFFTEGLYKKYLTPGESVVVLSHRGNAAMMFQAYTDYYFKVQGGFINASLSKSFGVPQVVENLSYPTGDRAEVFRSYAKKTGLGAIIVERAYSEHWMYIFDNMANFGYKATTVGGVTIFQLPGHHD